MQQKKRDQKHGIMITAERTVHKRVPHEPNVG